MASAPAQRLSPSSSHAKLTGFHSKVSGARAPLVLFLGEQAANTQTESEGDGEKDNAQDG
jgi:hypothetical protein